VFKQLISWEMLSLTVLISIPYILAALGGMFSERSGIINIGLEGIILNGALSAVLGTWYTGSPWWGLLSAVLGGGLTAFVHALATIRFRVNQIVSGFAVNLLAIGLTRFILKIVFHSSSNSERIPGLPFWQVSFLSQIPVINIIVTRPLVFITFLLIIGSYFFLFRTVFGLHLRSVGENPEAGDTLGLPVERLRYAGVLLSGFLAGLGGAWLALEQHQFIDGMSNGRGYIALAALIFGKWKPHGILLASLLFGFAEAMQIELQSIGVRLPFQFIQMIPYLLTIIVLSGVVGRSIPPAALGTVYRRE